MTQQTQNKQRVRELRELLPLFWSSYQHMYDARERKTKGMIDFLLVISTFLPILSVTLYTTDLFNHALILLPIVPQIISIIILLKYFVVNTPAVHLFELNKELLNSLNNGEFEVGTIATLRKIQGFTWVSLNEESKLIRASRLLILASLFLLILSAFFIWLRGGVILYVVCFSIATLFYYVTQVYYKKTPDFSNEDKIESDNLKLLNDWITARGEKNV